MEIKVIRKWMKQSYTMGRMYIDDNFFCGTLEDVVRDLNDYNHDGDYDDPGEGKIYGETAIPCGRYKVIVNESPKFKKRLPLLLDVPGFEGIRIHSGNSAKDSYGCILVGQNTSTGRLTNGPYFQTLLVQKIDEALNNGEETFIIIKE